MDSWRSCRTSFPAIIRNWASLAFGFSLHFNPKLQSTHATLSAALQHLAIDDAELTEALEFFVSAHEIDQGLHPASSIVSRRIYGDARRPRPPMRARMLQPAHAMSRTRELILADAQKLLATACAVVPRSARLRSPL